MFAAELRFLLAGQVGSAHSGNLIGGNGHADAAAAHQNATLHFPGGDFFTHLAGKVRIVNGIGGMGSLVLDLDAAGGQAALELFFQLEAGMIGAQCNLHGRHSTPLNRSI